MHVFGMSLTHKIKEINPDNCGSSPDTSIHTHRHRYTHTRALRKTVKTLRKSHLQNARPSTDSETRQYCCVHTHTHAYLHWQIHSD